MSVGDKKYVSLVEDWGQPEKPATLDENGVLDSEQWPNQIKQQSNRNLLDNWYFIGGGTNGNFPVNQRGQTSYSPGTEFQYCIDRWRMRRGTLVIQSDGVVLNWDGVNGTNAIFSQPYITDFFKNGETITISALVGNELISKTGTVDPALAIKSNKTTSGKTDIEFRLSGLEWQMVFWSYSTEGEVIKAAKLERGDTQTLAHQENGVWVLNDTPDYGTELAKCQRYFERIYIPSNFTLHAQTTNRLYANVFYQTTKRIVPSLSASLFYIVRATDNNGVYGSEVAVQPEMLSSGITRDGFSLRFPADQINSVAVNQLAYTSVRNNAPCYVDVIADI